MEKQNKLIERQNKRLDQQTYLQEADRRSSLVFQLGNILDGLDKEVKQDVGSNTVRDLSPELSGRIISLSRLLKPYRYLENDSLIPNPLSPERGQLLVSLLNSDLDLNTLRRIYIGADFSYSDLTRSNMVHFDFHQTRLSNSNWSDSYILRSNFLGANLSLSIFNNSIMQESSFDGTTLTNSSLQNCNLSYSTFKKANLQNVNLSHAILINTDFEEANLADVILDSARIKDKEWFLNLLRSSSDTKEISSNYYVDDKKQRSDLIGDYYLILRK